jgi:hypothetical protein
MCANSLEAAKHIKLICCNNTECAESFQYGVLIGGMSSNNVLLSQEDINLIKCSSSTLPSYLPEVCFSYQRFWKPFPNGMLYRKTEHVVLKDDDDDDASEVVCQVECFLCIEVEDSFLKCVKVLAYSAEQDEESNVLYDPYSGGLLIDTTTNVQTLIAPVTSIDRKFILYKCNNDAHPNRSVVVDFQRKSLAIAHYDIQIPFFPQVEDMVLIKGDGPDPWLANV